MLRCMRCMTATWCNKTIPLLVHQLWDQLCNLNIF
uniref:Uncharacterized protein n=1 Tax=Anopheles minimus TaxID=112268 RepID=A0A182WQ01_9DIPT